jgi:hypothetical protein
VTSLQCLCHANGTCAELRTGDKYRKSKHGLVGMQDWSRDSIGRYAFVLLRVVTASTDRTVEPWGIGPSFQNLGDIKHRYRLGLVNEGALLSKYLDLQS